MYVYGKNAVIELIKNKKKINKIYLDKKFNDQSVLKLIKNPIYLDKNQLNQLVNSNHQGIIAEVPNYKYNNLEELLVQNSLILILDHIEDPHNLGAIIRTVEAAGLNGIIIPKNRTVEVNSTVFKTSSGALSNTKVVQVTNLNETIKKLKKEGFWIVGTDMNGQSYQTIDMTGKIALIIGNEGKGLTRIIRESCDFIASIPMFGKVNSLNASVAAGVMIYEAIRQRNGV